MKIINEKGKLFGIINIIDLLIIIFVALVAWVMVMFFSSNKAIVNVLEKGPSMAMIFCGGKPTCRQASTEAGMGAMRGYNRLRSLASGMGKTGSRPMPRSILPFSRCTAAISVS